MIQAFRRAQCPEKTVRLKLGGLDPAARYIVTNLESGATSEASGRELSGLGLRVSLEDRPAAAVLTYRRVGSL